MQLLYARESRQITGVIYEVRNEMGGGWSEEIYHQALVENCHSHRIPIVSKPRLPLIHRGVTVHTFEPDILAWEKIVLELKVLPRFREKEFPSSFEAQTFHYLKRTGNKLGLLVNFAHTKVGMKRLAYEPPEMQVTEDYERIIHLLSESDKAILREIRQHILAIGHQYGTGYPETIYRKIIHTELAHHDIKSISDVNVPAHWKGKPIGHQATQHILVADRFLLLVRAITAGPPALDYIKTQTFLIKLGLKVGLVVNLGRNVLQIYGTAVK